jgi:hypothetical protein
VTIPLRRPERAPVVRPARPHESVHSERRLALEDIGRGLLVGAGVGALLMAGHTGVLGVTAAGILAIGAALASWGA